MRRLALVLVAATVLAAPAAATTGWTTHTVATSGFSLATPSSWVDLSGLSPQLLSALAAKNPELASLARTARQQKEIKLVAGAPNGYPNVNVIAIDARIPLATFVAVNVREIRGLSFVVGAVTTKHVNLPAGRAVMVHYLEAPAGRTIATLQYYIVHGGRAYIVTYTSLPSSERHDAPTRERSIATLRFRGA